MKGRAPSTNTSIFGGFRRLQAYAGDWIRRPTVNVPPNRPAPEPALRAIPERRRIRVSHVAPIPNMSVERNPAKSIADTSRFHGLSGAESTLHSITLWVASKMVDVRFILPLRPYVNTSRTFYTNRVNGDLICYTPKKEGFTKINVRGNRPVVCGIYILLTFTIKNYY